MARENSIKWDCPQQSFLQQRSPELYNMAEGRKRSGLQQIGPQRIDPQRIDPQQIGPQQIDPQQVGREKICKNSDNRRRNVGGQFLLLPLFCLFLSACSLTDLRTDFIKNAENPQQLSQQGRAILRAMEQSYGGRENWKRKKNIDIIFRDAWPGFVGENFFMPWFKSEELLQLSWQVGSDNSRLRFLEGPHKDLEWGIQNWVTYTKEPQQKINFKQDADIHFNLPTFQFFFESPFRLTNTDVASYAGEREWKGKMYDLVLVSWNTVLPQQDVDQYLLWIARDTKAIEILQYTVRDFAGFVSGTMFYDNFKRVGGLLFPFRLQVREALDAEDILHEVTVESIRFALPHPANYFVPNPSLQGNKYNK